MQRLIQRAFKLVIRTPTLSGHTAKQHDAKKHIAQIKIKRLQFLLLNSQTSTS